MQVILHAPETIEVILGQVRDRNTRHECEHLTDQALINLGDDVEISGFPLLLASGLLCHEVLLVIAQ